MVKRIERWVTEDGVIFDTKVDAEEYESRQAKIKVLKWALSFDLLESEWDEIYDFVENYTRGWK